METVMQRIRDLAERKRIEVVEDAFHGSKSIELRLTRDRHIHCVGFIFGPTGVEFYRRTMSKAREKVRQKLWMFASLFRTRDPESGSYQRLAVWSLRELANIDIETRIAEELPSANEN